MSAVDNSTPSKSNPSMSDKPWGVDSTTNTNKTFTLQSVFNLFKTNLDAFYASVETVFTKGQADALYPKKSEVYTKAEVDGLRESSYYGVAVPGTVPTAIQLEGSGKWDTTTEGTYSNMGGIVITAGDIADGRQIQIVYTKESDSWSKQFVGQNLGGYATKNELSIVEESISDVSFFEVVGTQIADSYYQQISGVLTSSSQYNTTKCDISGITDKLVASAEIRGTGAALAVYLDGSDTIIGREYIGQSGISDTYSRQLLSPPSGTVFVAITSYSATQYGILERKVYSPINFQEVQTELVETSAKATATEENIQEINNVLTEQNYNVVPGVNTPNYFVRQGDGSLISNSALNLTKVDITGITDPLYATANVSGTGTALAVYLDGSDAILGREFIGEAGGVEIQYNRQLISPVAGTVYVCIDNFDSNDSSFGYLERLETSYINVAESTEKANTAIATNHWYQKKIGFLGTSVLFGQQATKSYALEAANYLGFELLNTGMPGLSIHTLPGGASDEPNTFGTTTLSKAEYASYGTTIESSPITPYVPGGSYNNYYRTWENIFTPANVDVDLWVFAVIPNCTVFDTTDWDDFDKDNWAYNTGTFEDHRTTFLGALIYLFDKMYAMNPDARAVILLESGFSYNNCQDNVYAFAEEFKIPVIDVWKKINFNSKTKPNIWSVGGTNSHPSTFAHELMGKMLKTELLSIA